MQEKINPVWAPYVILNIHDTSRVDIFLYVKMYKFARRQKPANKLSIFL